MSLTGGNRNDVTQLLPLLDKIPAVAGAVGRPRRRPDTIFADRGYDHDKYRRLLRQRSIRPAIAERGQPHGTGLGTFRWVVERTISWLHGFRRLRIRWERRDDIHEAFLGLAVCLITHRYVQRLCQGQLLRGESDLRYVETRLDCTALAFDAFSYIRGNGRPDPTPAIPGSAEPKPPAPSPRLAPALRCRSGPTSQSPAARSAGTCAGAASAR